MLWCMYMSSSCDVQEDMIMTEGQDKSAGSPSADVSHRVICHPYYSECVALRQSLHAGLAVSGNIVLVMHTLFCDAY